MNSSCIVLNNEACHSTYEYNIETFETIGKLWGSMVDTCGCLWPVTACSCETFMFSVTRTCDVVLQNYAWMVLVCGWVLCGSSYHLEVVKLFSAWCQLFVSKPEQNNNWNWSKNYILFVLHKTLSFQKLDFWYWIFRKTFWCKYLRGFQ